jgi:hypothetical protein
MEKKQIERKIPVADLQRIFGADKQKSRPNSIRKSFSLFSRPWCKSASAWIEGRPKNSTL